MDEWDLILRIFNEYNRLDLVVKDAKSIIQKIILLCDWTHHQIPLWSYGGNIEKAEETQNPIHQLLAIKNGVLRGWCGNYAILFIAACESMDLGARHVLLSKKPEYGIDRHNVVEVWRPVKRRWMVLDPMFNIHFVNSHDTSKYLSAEEISRLVNNNSIDDVGIIHPVFSDHLNVSQRFKQNILNYFYKCEYSELFTTTTTTTTTSTTITTPPEMNKNE